MSPSSPELVRPVVSLVSLGCSKNQVDSERMLSSFVARGYRYHPDGQEADLLVVNTCGFIAAAREQSIETILSCAEIKKERPGMRLVVAGCMVERYGEDLRQELPEVDYWVGADLAASLDAIATAELGLSRHPMQTLGPRSILLNEPGMAYLRISQGCDRTCSFCAIPGFKGKQASVPVVNLVEEARGLVERGAHELILNAQDLCRYGADIGYEPGLTGLVEALLEGTQARWIRLLYAYPFSLPDGVIALMADNPRVVRYLEMPFQHADSAVLKYMRRGHRGEKFLEYIEDFRERVPDLVVRSTMLVGHPGETEEAFDVLCDFVEAARFEWMGVFEYSDEEGTHAMDLGEKVPAEVAAERAQILRELFEENRRLDAFRLGEECDALVSSREAGRLVCRVAGQAPEVDGLTFAPDPGDVETGSMIRLIPERVDGMDLLARISGRQIQV
jgi:ribosomal protein S12 methylthiotransferase